MITSDKAKYCFFCVNSISQIDYKNTQMLQRFLSSYGKIVPRRRSGVCSKHQRILANTIKRSRFLALLPYVSK